MVPELVSRQILALASQGSGVSEIASSLGIEEPFVKLVLERHAEVDAVDRDINDDELKALRHHAFRLATEANDETVQARLTMFLIERDKPSKERGGSSILAINKALVLANDSFQNLVKDYAGT